MVINETIKDKYFSSFTALNLTQDEKEIIAQLYNYPYVSEYLTMKKDIVDILVKKGCVDVVH